MKKIVYLVLALMLVGIVSAECDYYVGDEITLPQITTTKTYDDGTTHKMYLACLYSLTGEGANFESMISTQNCRESVDTFTPSSAGDYTYDLNIYYRERQWNPTTHLWETIAEGSDNSLQETYSVCEIPPDDEGPDDFIEWIKSLLCQWFGVFCDGPQNGDWLYQETADSVMCMGQWSTSHPCLNIYDNDWSTYAWVDVGYPMYGYFYSNYTKPTNATSSSLWQVKDNVGIVNLTINNLCWEQNPLQLRVFGEYDGDEVRWQCWNSTDWFELRGGMSSFNELYEEAMLWRIS